MKYLDLALLASLPCLSYFSFVLGRRWEAMTIKNALQEKGSVISQYGDHDMVEIFGTARELK